MPTLISRRTPADARAAASGWYLIAPGAWRALVMVPAAKRSAWAERRSAEADVRIVEDRGNFGGPFPVALIPDVAREAAAGPADDALGSPLHG